MLGPQGLDGSLTPPLAQPVTAKKYRVTKSISLAGPTEADFQRNTELEKFLIHSGLYECNEDAAKREAVLGRIGEVLGPGADMDTLCVGPSYVNRKEDFFIILHDMLAEMEEVSELQPVPHARVPIMKYKF
ncbi:polynucleotide adenylyltransferase [Sarracenia purpurea var. burkii]